MTEKFTEEEYQKIVDVADKYPNFGQEYIIPNGGEGEWSTTDKELIKEMFGSFYNHENNLTKVQYMMAIANPLTREWAYNNFVEKEKKYIWHLRRQNKHNVRVRLYKDLDDGSVSNYWTEKDNKFYEAEKLTESEIKAWGFNPESFDKEEVS